MGLFGGHFRNVLSRHGCRSTDSFAGFRLDRRISTLAGLAALIRRLPPGVTEFMCHPGHCGEELRAARTRLRESRERELAALTDPGVRSALAQAGVELVNYRSL